MSESADPAALDGVPPPQPEPGFEADAEVEMRDGTAPDFCPVPVRYRYDGWVPDKQTGSSSSWPHAAASRRRRGRSA